ncbi:MAG: hypothetical protein ACQET1_09690 [Gemmatimonadota bacterium]
MRPWVSVILWILAVAIMFAAAGYQERTGPTKEFKGALQLGGVTYEYALNRSGNTDADAPILLPDPGPEVSGRVIFKRYPTEDPFSAVPMESLAGELQGLLPRQPAAGKLEYYVTLDTPEGTIRIPEGDETLIIRYKDPVPLKFLVPHVIFMFLALLVGVRTALGALFQPEGVRRLAWTTLALMSIGGMILGPIVQKHAFGAFWTGWPFGYDLTDNKTLLMWIVWVGVAVLLRKRRDPRDWLARSGVLLAAVVMLTVYVIPHSLQGSEFNYEEMEVDTG